VKQRRLTCVSGGGSGGLLVFLAAAAAAYLCFWQPRLVYLAAAAAFVFLAAAMERQRRLTCVYGGLGLCLFGCGRCGDLGFLWRWLVFLAAAAVEIGVLCLCFCQLRWWLVFLAPVAEPRVTDGLGCGRDFCFWRPLLVLQQQQNLCVAILLTYIVHL
jgi:hypothetical protein